jgi:uncharacterized protein YciI
MRSKAFVVSAFCLALAATAPASPAAPPPPSAAPNAGPFGYEMTTYYVALLYRGPNWSAEETPERQRIMQGHLANIGRLAEEGKLILAGPFRDGSDLSGMFVFQVASLEEAKALCDTDPAVQAGRLRVELHPWYSAKGIHAPKPAPKP